MRPTNILKLFELCFCCSQPRHPVCPHHPQRCCLEQNLLPQLFATLLEGPAALLALPALHVFNLHGQRRQRGRPLLASSSWAWTCFRAWMLLGLFSFLFLFFHLSQKPGPGCSHASGRRCLSKPRDHLN